jgi:competence protein ComEC
MGAEKSHPQDQNRGGVAMSHRQLVWAAFLLALVCAQPARLPVVPGPAPRLTVSFLDVGQGDAALVRFPDSTTLLVDAGPDSQALMTHLRREHISRLGRVVITHPHSDHYIGLFLALDSITVDTVYVNGRRNDVYYDWLLAKINQRGVPCRTLTRGDTLRFSDGLAAVLHPDTAAWPAADPNEESLVLKVSCRSVEFLLTGDITAPAESALVALYGGKLAAPVLKVPHHGSRTSSSDDFIDAVAPRYAVVCVGLYNTYGLPNQDVLDRYLQHGVTVYRTDRDGTIGFESTEDSIALRYAP